MDPNQNTQLKIIVHSQYIEIGVLIISLVYLINQGTVCNNINHLQEMRRYLYRI